MANIYTGTIKPTGYQLLSSLTGINFETDITYQIQLLNPAYLREGLIGKGFLVNTNKPFSYKADTDLYIAVPPTPYGTVTLNISKEISSESISGTDSDSNSDIDTNAQI